MIEPGIFRPKSTLALWGGVATSSQHVFQQLLLAVLPPPGGVSSTNELGQPGKNGLGRKNFEKGLNGQKGCFFYCGFREVCLKILAELPTQLDFGLVFLLVWVQPCPARQPVGPLGEGGKFQ